MRKARPILMSAPMVRALLEGRKTQTRRVVKLPKKMRGKWEPSTIGGGGCFSIKDGMKVQAPEQLCIWNTTTGRVEICPYGNPSDLLWVRETWLSDLGHGLLYKADYAASDTKQISKTYTWKPSIHMPRWASRLTLENTEVCVQRLQEIGEDDAIAEGLIIHESMGGCKTYRYEDDGEPYSCPIESYTSLWESINGKGSWAANPWVWALTFTVHQKNIEEILNA